MFRYAHFALCAIALLSSACSRATTMDPTPPAGTATLRDTAGRTLGTVTVTSAPEGGVRFRIQATGLTPGSHGIHVHAVGACDAATPTAFSSAGGHFNPHARQHGRLNPNGWHAGDLPNLVVSAAGTGTLDIVVENLTLDGNVAALFDADGSAIVVHANPDDERTDTGPAGPGNSGGRIACGVIERR
jgi:Cu-Zn family superoxide dismutase